VAVPLIRTSERGDFKTCQFLWYHHWVRGLSSPRVPTWSWFGTAIHKALEVRYPPGIKRAPLADVLAAFEAACMGEDRRIREAGGDIDDEAWHDGLELGKAMLTGYVKHYDQDSRWEVIHTEQSFQIDVRHPVTGRLIAVYCGTWDLFVWDRIDKVYRLVDHKTRAQFKQDWQFYDLNDQGGSYLWVAPEVLRHKGLLGKNDHIDGIVFNMLRKAMPQPTAEDGIRYNMPKKPDFMSALANAGVVPGPRTSLKALAVLAKEHSLDVKGAPRAVQPSPLFARYTTRRGMEQRVNQGRKVLAEATHMDLVRRGRLPILKHPTEDCIRCPLFDFCQLEELDPEEAEAYAASMLVVRDGYADHRAAMQEGGIEVKEKRASSKKG
jgi:hypothetical protein